MTEIIRMMMHWRCLRWRGMLCPFGRKEMVKNFICGRVYDTYSMEFFEEQHRGIKGGNLSMLGLYNYVLVPLDPYNSEGCAEDYVWLYLLRYNQQQRYIDLINTILASTLTDHSYDARVGAVNAAFNYLLIHEKNTRLEKNYAHLLGSIDASEEK